MQSESYGTWMSHKYASKEYRLFLQYTSKNMITYFYNIGDIIIFQY